MMIIPKMTSTIHQTATTLSSRRRRQRGLTDSISLLLGVLLSLAIGLSPSNFVIVVDAQPSKFIAEPVSSAYAIAGTFATNPRNNDEPMMILVEKTGTVRVIEDPDNGGKEMVILDLEDKMCLNTERGLQTVAIHPNFKENRWVYLYYNVYKEGCLADDSLDGPWNVLARFVMDPDTLMLDFDEQEVLWR
jgi:Glucose / Sorbosone dehydrogenase